MMKDDEKMMEKFDESFMDDESGGEINGSSNNLQNSGDDDGRNTTILSSFIKESKYYYEEIERNQLNEILECIEKLSIDSKNNFADGNQQQQQQFNHDVIFGGGGDAEKNVQILQAQLVHIRIRPQHVEYLRAKPGWSGMCKFKPKIPSQYIQINRTLLSLTPCSDHPQSPSASS